MYATLPLLTTTRRFLRIFPKLTYLYKVNYSISHVFVAGGLNSQNVDKIFHSLTVERLQALLKEKGLSRRGKKASALLLITLFIEY